MRRIAEHKFIEEYWAYIQADPSIDPTYDWAITYNGIFIDLTLVTDGIGVNNRIGSKIQVTSVQMKIMISYANISYANFTQPRYVDSNGFSLRVIIFTWKANSNPNVEDIVSDSFGGFWSNNQRVLSPLNHEKKRKRKLWYDKTFNAGWAAESSLGLGMTMNMDRLQQVHEIYIPMHTDNEVFFPSDEFTEIPVNRIFCLLLSNEPQTNLAYPVYTFHRTNFIDA